jgi:hypothetical protein
MKQARGAIIMHPYTAGNLLHLVLTPVLSIHLVTIQLDICSLLHCSWWKFLCAAKYNAAMKGSR